MPHNVPEEKEWLHLRDAICLGDVDAIVDQLLMEGIVVEYGEMEAELISMKTNLGWDSCAVVDKETFKESINKLISESVAIPQPQDAPEFKTYKESVDSRRWDRIFDDMIGRASGRTAPSRDNVNIDPYIFLPLYWGARDRGEESFMYEGREVLVTYAFYVVQAAGWADVTPEELSQGDDYPSHYTDKTPEGALEAMERRLSGGFSEQMAEALAQMELKVGELAEAVRRMGASVPAPIVEVVAEVEEAVEAVEEALEGGSLSRQRSRAIREYIIGLGERASEANTATVADALRDRFPAITIKDVTNAIRLLPPGTPKLGRAPMGRPPPVQIRMPLRGKARIVANYLVSLGADTANTDMETFLAGINAANPGLSPPVAESDYHATVRRFPDLPRLSLTGRGYFRSGGSTSLEDRMQSGYQRPERIYGF